MKHTPTPWKIAKVVTGDVITQDNGNVIIPLCHMKPTALSEEQNRANAEHIVKCVNAHDALIGALKLIKQMASDARYSKPLSEIHEVAKQALEAAGERV